MSYFLLLFIYGLIWILYIMIISKYTHGLKLDLIKSYRYLFLAIWLFLYAKNPFWIAYDQLVFQSAFDKLLFESGSIYVDLPVIGRINIIR